MKIDIGRIMICKVCKERKIICGQAFTTFKCGICREHYSHPNTHFPKYCRKCANEHYICQYCGMEIEPTDTTEKTK